MLRVHIWDEISGEWGRWELDLPHVCRDPQAVNNELDRAFGEHVDPDEPHWRVTHSTRCGPLMVAIARGRRGHCAILLVNDQEQESEYRCPECESEQARRGYFYSGLPGVIARVENGSFEKAERCDTCLRFASDEEATAALRKYLDEEREDDTPLSPDQPFFTNVITRAGIAENLNDHIAENLNDYSERPLSDGDDRLSDAICQEYAERLGALDLRDFGGPGMASIDGEELLSQLNREFCIRMGLIEGNEPD